MRESAKSQLSALVGKVLADGKVDDAEREALRKVFRRQILSARDVREVLGQYMQGLKAEILSDGALTPDEIKRCQALVDQLRIPLRCLPPELLDVVLGKKRRQVH